MSAIQILQIKNNVLVSDLERLMIQTTSNLYNKYTIQIAIIFQKVKFPQIVLPVEIPLYMK
jgi:hypothetical protein